MTATAQQEVLQGILPKVNINKITISSSPNEDKLNVTLNLIVKETLDNDQFGTWFNQNMIIKYVNIAVFQSTNQDVTSILSYSNDIIQGFNTINTNLLLTNERLLATGFISATSSIIAIQQERERIRGLLSSTNNISSHFISLLHNTDLTSFSSYPDSDGNLIYEIPFQISFEVRNSNPQHLSYFVLTTINLDQLSRDFNIDFDLLSSFEQNGKVTSEIVIDNFQVVDTSYIYVDGSGQTWDGPVHLSSNNVWRTGEREEQTSIDLTLTAVPNNKVQDFRNISEIERKIVDFSSLFSSVSSITDIAKIQSVDYKLSGDDPIFSELFLSRDYDGVVKLFFGIDFSKALKQFSSIGHLYNIKNNNFKEAALNSSKILKLNIKRRRVQNNFNKKVDLAEYEIKEMLNSNNDYDNEIFIIGSKDRYWKEFVERRNQKVFIGEVDVSTEEEFYNPLSKSIRYFSATDKLFVEKEKINFEGLYQYGVELEVEDGAVNLITTVLNLLNRSKNTLTQYYNIVSAPTMKRFFLENDNPHLATRAKDPSSRNIINYGFDITTNKISDQLASNLEERYHNSEPWIDQPSVLLYALSLFTAVKKKKKKKDNFLIVLQNYLNPRSGNPTSISKVIELFDYMITALKKLIKVNADSSEQITNSLRDKSASQRELRTFKVSKMFNTFYNSSYGNSMGVDYFSTSKRRTAYGFGTKRILIDEFMNIADQDLRKYFGSTSLPEFTENITYQDPRNETRRVEQIVNLSRSSVGIVDQCSHISPVRFDLSKYSIFTSPLNNNNSTIAIPSIYDGNIFENMATLFSEILQFKLEKSVKLSNQFYPLYNERSDNVATITNKQKIIFDFKELWKNYLNCDFLNYTIGTATSQQTTQHYNPSTGMNQEAGRPILTLEQPNASELLKFLTAISISAIKSSDLNFQINNGLMTYNLRDNLKRLRNGQFSRSDSYLEAIIKAPYHIKAIAARESTFVPFLRNYFAQVNFDQGIESKALNYFYFDNIMEIQYLSNFSNEMFIAEKLRSIGVGSITEQQMSQTTQDALNINNPEWKVLTMEKINNMRQSTEQQYILCRLVPYNNRSIGVDSDTDIQNFIYNKYFIIQNKDNVTRTNLTPEQYITTELRNINDRSRQLYTPTRTSSATTNPVSRQPRG